MASTNEFGINTTIPGVQAVPEVAALTNGEYVAVWHSGSNTTNWVINARIFAADGTPSTVELAINTPNAASADDAAVAALEDGGFVVTWSETEQVEDGPWIVTTHARTFEADGTPREADVTLSGNTGDSAVTAVTGLVGGGYAVAWDHYDSDAALLEIAVRAYRDDGSLRYETVVHSDASNVSNNVDIAARPDGGFVVTWRVMEDDSYRNMARVIDADGNPLTDSFQIAPGVSAETASVAVLGDGSFVVTWDAQNPDSGTRDAYARIYDVDGSPAGDAFVVNATLTGNQSETTVTALADGSFLVAWTSSDGGDGAAGALIRARVFGADGQPAGDEIVINTDATSDQQAPSLTVGADGKVFVAWHQFNGSMADYYNVEGRLIELNNSGAAPTALALDGDSVAENARRGDVVGTLSATDADGNPLTYTLTDDAGGLFAIEMIDGAPTLIVAGALDYETAPSHDITVRVTDPFGGETSENFTIAVEDIEPESQGMITIDATAAGTTAFDFEAFIRGGFLTGTAGGGMPVFDNGGSFSGEEMFIAFGPDAASKYVFAHGDLEYYFNGHTVHGTINTIEYGVRGAGSFDANGYFTGGSAQLKITGLDLFNALTPEVEVEANGPVHNFAVGHMYGSSGDPARIDKYADALDGYAQKFLGSAGADIFTGTGFDDEFTGNRGNDVFDGGDGYDTVFLGNSAYYVVTANADGSVTVLDRLTQFSPTMGTGTDTYWNVELIKYSNNVQLEMPVNQAPADIALSALEIAENADAGTVVGTLSGTDPEGGTLTWSLVDDAGGLFEIVDGDLVITGPLDFEEAASHSVTVRATDEAGNATDQDFTVAVTDVVEAPGRVAIQIDGDESVLTPGTAILSESAAGFFGVVAADMDGDGDLDLVVNRDDPDTANGRVISLLVNDGSGNFAAPTVLATSAGVPNNASTLLVTTDFDGDGDLDLIAPITTGTGSPVVLTNNGSGGFTASDLYASSSNTGPTAIGDIDGDSDADIVQFGAGTTLNTYINNGGTLSAPIASVKSASSVTSTQIVDLDGDGLNDLLAIGGTSTTWYKNNGNGTFATGQALSGGVGGTRYAAATDFDGDGDVDIATISSIGGVTFVENLGNGSFAAGVLVVPRANAGLGSTSAALTAGDVDGDGDADLIVADVANDDIVTLINDGTGNFSVVRLNDASAINAPRTTVVADLNGDGLADIVSAGSQGNETASVVLFESRVVREVEAGVENALDFVTLTASGGGSAPVEVTLSAGSGVFTAVSGAGVTVAGSGTASVTLSGSIAGINAFLAAGSASFTPIDGLLRPVDIAVRVEDASGVLLADSGMRLNPWDDNPDLAPTDFALDLYGPVSEAYRPGFVIGTLSATDPEGGPITWSLPTLHTGGGLTQAQLDENNTSRDFRLVQLEDGSTGVAVNLLGGLDFESGTYDGHYGGGRYAFVAVATDALGNEARHTFFIQVTDEHVRFSATPTGWDFAGLAENAEEGQSVGYMSTYDGSFTPVSYSLVDDAGGRFRMEGANLVVNGPLDYETAPDHAYDVTMRATDANGVSHDKTIELRLIDAPEAGDTARGTITIDANTALAGSNGGVNWDTYLDARFAAVAGGLPNGVQFAPGTSPEYVYSMSDGTFTSLRGSNLAYWWADPVTGVDIHVVGGEVNSLSFGGGTANGVTDPELTISGLDLVGGATMDERISGEVNVMASTWMHGPNSTTPAELAHVKAILASYAQHFIGSEGDDTYTGTMFDDLIEGGDGNDWLDGGDGADRMEGGAGDDTYVFGLGDRILEQADSGIDTVLTDIAHKLRAHVENLELTGTAGINGRGNELDNVITGNGGDNALSGEAGNDTLLGGGGDDRLSGGEGDDTMAGGLGIDRLSGGEGDDTFLFDTVAAFADRDRIVDFGLGDDVIALDSAVFTALSAGALTTDEFFVGTRAQTANQHIIYNDARGVVMYDADGSGAGAATRLVALTGNPALSASDFLVV